MGDYYIWPTKPQKRIYWRVGYCSPALIKILKTKETIIMTKNDMIKAVASETDVTNKVAEAVMEAY